MLLGEVRQAARGLRRAPGFTAAAVATMALGIGANTTIYSFVNALLLRPLPFPDAQRLVTIESVRGNEPGKLMPREWEELDRDGSVFEGVAGWYPSQYNLTAGGKPEVVRACMTTANLFRVLGAGLRHGTSWEEGTHRVRNPSVVLNFEFWRNRLGGDPGIVQRTITMDHSLYQVTGVAEPGFEFPAGTDVFRAAHLGAAQNSDVRSLFIVARLRPGVTVERAQQRLEAFAAEQERIYPETNRGIRFRMTSLREAYAGDVRQYLVLTAWLAALVLLIACINTGNLLLSRGAGRRKELAVRAALGAGRGALLRPQLYESLLLTIAGGAAGLVLAAWWTRALRGMLRVELPGWMTIDLDGSVLLFTLATSVACGVAAGLLPALFLSGTNLAEGFNESSRGSSGGGKQALVRRVLVAGEMAAAVALLILAGLLVQSFGRLLETDPGFRRDRMLTFRTDPPWTRYNRVEQTSQFYRQAMERIQALPGVEGVAANHSLPLAVNQNYGKPGIAVEGQSADEARQNPFVNVQIVSPNYFAVMDIPVEQGRGFTGSDRIGAPLAAVLSRPLAARLFGTGNPVGRRVRLNGLTGALNERQEEWFEVIGVSGGVKSGSLLEGPGMDLYLSNQQQFAGDSFFIVRTSRAEIAGMGAAAAEAIRQIDPEQPIFDVQALDELVENTVWQRRIAGRLSVWFGGLALALAGIGAYSVLSYAVSQRTRELGIRHALGSTPRQLLGLVVREGMTVAGAGMIAGAVLGAGAAQGLSGLFYGVSALDPQTFLAAISLAAAAALIACVVPGRRAAKTDPMTALRAQ